VRSGVLPGITLLGTAALAYVNSLGGVFQFDDYNVIVNNPAVHSWDDWRNSMPGIRPLLKLSYLINWLSGPAPLGFHLVNLLCHLGSTLLVYLLMRRAAQEFVAGAPVEQVAWLAAALFALHPAHTEAVTYISGRSVSLMAALYLGSAVAYLHGVSHSRRMLYQGLSPLLFMGALAVKETAWTLPFALLLWEFARAPHGWRRALGRLAVHGTALAAGLMLILACDGYQRLLGASLGTRTPFDNLLVQAGGVWYLITQPLLALHINIDPDLPAITSLSPVVILKGLALAGLFAWGLFELPRRTWLGFGILWFFLHLAPTNSLVARLDVANDRQLYLASLGPALIASVLLHRLLAPRSALGAGLALAAVLAAATVARNAEYRSEVELWQATVQDSPLKARAWNNLGYAHRLAGDTESARAAFRRALSLDPQLIRAEFNLRALKE
jgi:tetratricopeptide (TPR) repeat protein